MSSTVDSLFKEFFDFCSAVLDNENPQILNLIQHRYDECNNNFRYSHKMVDLLASTRKKMEEEKSRQFVHLKEFTDAMKCNRKSRKKDDKKRKREITLPLCSVTLERTDANPENEDLKDAKRRKIQSCSLGDGQIENAKIIRDCTDCDEISLNLDSEKTEKTVCLNDPDSPTIYFNPKRIHISKPVPIVILTNSDDIIQTCDLPHKAGTSHKLPPSPSKDRHYKTDGDSGIAMSSYLSQFEEFCVSRVSGKSGSREESQKGVVDSIVRHSINENNDVLENEDPERNEGKKSPDIGCEDKTIEVAKCTNKNKTMNDENESSSPSATDCVFSEKIGDCPRAVSTPPTSLLLGADKDSPSEIADSQPTEKEQVLVNGDFFHIETDCPSSSKQKSPCNRLLDKNDCVRDTKSSDGGESWNAVDCVVSITEQTQDKTKTKTAKSSNPNSPNNTTCYPNEASCSGVRDSKDGIHTSKDEESVSIDSDEISSVSAQETDVSSPIKDKGACAIIVSDEELAPCSPGNSCVINEIDTVYSSVKDKQRHSGELKTNDPCLGIIDSAVEEDTDSKAITIEDELDKDKDKLLTLNVKDTEPSLKMCEKKSVDLTLRHSNTNPIEVKGQLPLNGIDDLGNSHSKHADEKSSLNVKIRESSSFNKDSKCEDDIYVNTRNVESMVSGEKSTCSNVEKMNERGKTARRVPIISLEDVGTSKMSFLGSLSLGTRASDGNQKLNRSSTSNNDREKTGSLSPNCADDAEANSADEFAVDETARFRRLADDAKAKGKKPPSERHVKKLEQLLEKLRDEIEKGRELTLEDLDQEDSFYIYEDKLKKKFIAAWNKLCELTNRTVTTGRPTERTIHYSGTRYSEINRRLAKFLNKRKAFPDFQDVKTIIKLTNKKCNLRLSAQMVNDVAREAFVDIGEMLQTRRHKDFIATFGSRQIDTCSTQCDPAFSDAELRRKLESNRKVATSNLDAVINKYTQLQYAGTAMDDDDDDDDDDEDDRKEGKHWKKKTKFKDDKESRKKRRRIHDQSSEEDEEDEEVKKKDLDKDREVSPCQLDTVEGGETKSGPNTSLVSDDEEKDETSEKEEEGPQDVWTGPNIKYTQRKPISFSTDNVAQRVSPKKIIVLSNPESEDETSESDEDKEGEDDGYDKKDDDDDLDVLVVSSENSDDESSGASRCPSSASVISLGSDSEDGNTSKPGTIEAVEMKPNIKTLDMEVDVPLTECDVNNDLVSSREESSPAPILSKDKQEKEQKGSQSPAEITSVEREERCTSPSVEAVVSSDLQSTPTKKTTELCEEVILISDTPIKSVGDEGDGSQLDEDWSCGDTVESDISDSETRKADGLKWEKVLEKKDIPKKASPEKDERLSGVVSDDDDDAVCVIMDIRSESEDHQWKISNATSERVKHTNVGGSEKKGWNSSGKNGMARKQRGELQSKMAESVEDIAVGDCSGVVAKKGKEHCGDSINHECLRHEGNDKCANEKKDFEKDVEDDVIILSGCEDGGGASKVDECVNGLESEDVVKTLSGDGKTELAMVQDEFKTVSGGERKRKVSLSDGEGVEIIEMEEVVSKGERSTMNSKGDTDESNSKGDKNEGNGTEQKYEKEVDEKDLMKESGREEMSMDEERNDRECVESEGEKEVSRKDDDVGSGGGGGGGNRHVVDDDGSGGVLVVEKVGGGQGDKNGSDSQIVWEENIGGSQDAVEKDTEDVEESTEDVEKSTEDVEKSTEDVEKSTEDVEKSTEDVEKSTEVAVEENTDDGDDVDKENSDDGNKEKTDDVNKEKTDDVNKENTDDGDDAEKENTNVNEQEDVEFTIDKMVEELSREDRGVDCNKETGAGQEDVDCNKETGAGAGQEDEVVEHAKNEGEKDGEDERRDDGKRKKFEDGETRKSDFNGIEDNDGGDGDLVEIGEKLMDSAQTGDVGKDADADVEMECDDIMEADGADDGKKDFGEVGDLKAKEDVEAESSDINQSLSEGRTESNGDTPIEVPDKENELEDDESEKSEHVVDETEASHSTRKKRDKEEDFSEEWKLSENDDFEVYLDRGDEEEDDGFNSLSVKFCESVEDDGDENKDALPSEVLEVGDDDDQNELKILKCNRSKEDDRKLVDELMKNAVEVTMSSCGKRKSKTVESTSREETDDNDNDNDLEITNVEFVPAAKRVKMAGPVSPPVPNIPDSNKKSILKGSSYIHSTASHPIPPGHPAASRNRLARGGRGNQSYVRGGVVGQSGQTKPGGVNWDLIRASLPPVGDHSSKLSPIRRRGGQTSLNPNPFAINNIRSVRPQIKPQSNFNSRGRGTMVSPSHRGGYSRTTPPGGRFSTVGSRATSFSAYQPNPRHPTVRRGQLLSTHNSIPSLGPRVPIPRIPSPSAVKLPFHNNKMLPRIATTHSPRHHLPYSPSPRPIQNNAIVRPANRPPLPHSSNLRGRGRPTMSPMRKLLQDRQAYVAKQQKKIDGLVMVLDDSDDDETNDDSNTTEHDKLTTDSTVPSPLLKTSPSAGNSSKSSSPKDIQKNVSPTTPTKKKGAGVIVLSDSE